MKYRTIVADPPWEQSDRRSRSGVSWREGVGYRNTILTYPTMPIAEIEALPVAESAATDAHLFLWTTQLFLEAAPGVARAWGFKPSCTLVWCKPNRGWGLGGVFQSNTEFVIYARRGRPDPSRHAVSSQWFTWDRGRHSAKPEAFVDLVEFHFPPPRLEMFARRNRLGWDTWGDDALEHVEMETA